MAEHVERSRWRDTRRAAGLSERSLCMRFPPQLSIRSLKHQGIARFSHCKPAKKDDPVIGQNDVTRLPALGSPDHNRAGFAIEIIHAKRGELAIAASRKQRGLDHLSQAWICRVDQATCLVKAPSEGTLKLYVFAPGILGEPGEEGDASQ